MIGIIYKAKNVYDNDDDYNNNDDTVSVINEKVLNLNETESLR